MIDKIYNAEVYKATTMNRLHTPYRSVFYYLFGDGCMLLRWGTTRLLGQVTDLSLDYPRCSEMLTEVIIRPLAELLGTLKVLLRHFKIM